MTFINAMKDFFRQQLNMKLHSQQLFWGACRASERETFLILQSSAREKATEAVNKKIMKQ